jgi:hypothetical protein
VLQWAWSYYTRNRSARLITGKTGHPLTVVPPERPKTVSPA